MKSRTTSRPAAGLLAALLVSALPLQAWSYDHQRVFLSDGGPATWQRHHWFSSTMPYRIHIGMIFDWTWTRPGGVIERLNTVFFVAQQTIQGFDAWGQVPWAEIHPQFGGWSERMPQYIGNQPLADSENTVFYQGVRPTAHPLGRFGEPSREDFLGLATPIVEADGWVNPYSIESGLQVQVAAAVAGLMLGLAPSPVNDDFGANTAQPTMGTPYPTAGATLLTPDDIGGISTLYPSLLTSTSTPLNGGSGSSTTFPAYQVDFGSVSGSVYGGVKGAAVLLVDLRRGGAVMGVMLGTTWLPNRSGLTGNLDQDANSGFRIDCVPAGRYLLVVCPAGNYMQDVDALAWGSGTFSTSTLTREFTPSVLIVDVRVGRTTDVPLYGQSGDGFQDKIWNQLDLDVFDRFVSNMGSFPWSEVLRLWNTFDLNRDGWPSVGARVVLQELVDTPFGPWISRSVFGRR